MYSMGMNKFQALAKDARAILNFDNDTSGEGCPV